MIKTYDFVNDAEYTKVNAVISGGKGKLGFVNNPGQTFEQTFASAAGFTYDSAKAEFVGGKVQQKANAIIEAFLQEFTSDVGFTYDNLKAEFASGLARQKNQRPTNATFGATFTNNINGSWGNGVLTGTAFGGASVSGGKLDLTGGTKYVRYAALNNASSYQQGAVRLKYTPAYSGAPGLSRCLFSISESTSSYNNMIFVRHLPTSGYIELSVFSNTGATIISVYLNNWLPVAGQEYEFEVDYDITSGATRLFIDGVQFGATQTGTGIRSGTIGTIHIGANYLGSLACDGYINDVEIFSTVQHTANYTPGYLVPEYDYLETIVQCPIMSYLYNILSFGAPTVTEINAPKYIVNGYYWSGAAWVASSNTYATAMSYADWVANIATFPSSQFGSGVTIKVVFQGSNTLGSIDSIGFNINENHYVANSVILPELEYTGLGTLISFDDFLTVESGTPRYTLQIGRSGVYLYHNGVAWVASNGTYAQANTMAEFLANVATLPVLGQIYGQFKILFTDSNTQSYVDNLWCELTEQKYSSQGTLLTLDSLNAQSITALSHVVTESGDNKVYYVIVKDDVNYYHDGDNWVESTDPYSQNNTLAEIIAELATLLDHNQEIQLLVVLKSADQTETPQIDTFSVTYVFGGLEPIPANTARVYGYIEDLEGTPIEGVRVTVEVNIEANEYCEVASRITAPSIPKTTNDDGYFEFLLPWSSEFDSENEIKYTLEVVKTDVINISKKSGDIIEFTIDDDTTEINLSSRIAMA